MIPSIAVGAAKLVASHPAVKKQIRKAGTKAALHTIKKAYMPKREKFVGFTCGTCNAQYRIVEHKKGQANEDS